MRIATTVVVLPPDAQTALKASVKAADMQLLPDGVWKGATSCTCKCPGLGCALQENPVVAITSCMA